MTTIARGSIVVGVDGTPSSDLAVDWAIEEASRRSLPLHLLNAFPHDDTLPEGDVATWLAGVRARATASLESAAARARKAGLTTTSATTYAAPAHALVEASKRADTVVIGSRGLGTVRGVIQGSVSTQVAAHAACPVVVVRSGAPSGLTTAGRVIVGIDGSETSEAALGYAFAQASSRGAELVVVHAWWPEFVYGALQTPPQHAYWDELARSERILLAEAMAGWSEKYPDVVVHERSVRDAPVTALVDRSETADLLVVGTRGRGGFAGLLLGSVSQGVIQLAACPVAVVQKEKR